MESQTPSTQAQSFFPRFEKYFQKPVAQQAAHSLADGAEMEFQVATSDGKVLERFTFTREGGRNKLVPSPARSPQLLFTLTPPAAGAILDDPAEDIGPIGVNIAKLIVSTDANRRVSIQFKAGFFSLFQKGYFGVITAGGSQFASYLASRGLSGMGAIKAALKKIKP